MLSPVHNARKEMVLAETVVYILNPTRDIVRGSTVDSVAHGFRGIPRSGESRRHPHDESNDVNFCLVPEVSFCNRLRSCKSVD